MATFMVFTRLATKDQAALDAYNAKAGATLRGHTVTPLVAFGAQEVLEGPAHEGMVIMSFADRAAALAWYDGPEYREAREDRFRGADYQVTLVEGR